MIYAGEVEAGTIDYNGGFVALDYWQNGAELIVTSCLTRYGNWVGSEASFRSQLSPLKPEALSFSATADDGTMISAIGDEDGNFTGDYVDGTVNYDLGTATVRFGEMVEGEWVEKRIDPSTIRYNAVAYSYLPLNADILGIDPVRLPSDGRVPIYRDGDIVLIMHKATTGAITRIGSINHLYLVGSQRAVSPDCPRAAWASAVSRPRRVTNRCVDRHHGPELFPTTAAPARFPPLRLLPGQPPSWPCR